MNNTIPAERGTSRREEDPRRQGRGRRRRDGQASARPVPKAQSRSIPVV